MELANKIWNKHIEVFDSFDLRCPEHQDLDEETKNTALFSAIVTLESMFDNTTDFIKSADILNAIKYLKCSKHYAEHNKNSTY